MNKIIGMMRSVIIASSRKFTLSGNISTDWSGELLTRRRLQGVSEIVLGQPTSHETGWIRFKAGQIWGQNYVLAQLCPGESCHVIEVV